VVVFEIPGSYKKKSSAGTEGEHARGVKPPNILIVRILLVTEAQQQKRER